MDSTSAVPNENNSVENMSVHRANHLAPGTAAGGFLVSCSLQFPGPSAVQLARVKSIGSIVDRHAHMHSSYSS